MRDWFKLSIHFSVHIKEVKLYNDDGNVYAKLSLTNNSDSEVLTVSTGRSITLSDCTCVDSSIVGEEMRITYSQCELG